MEDKYSEERKNVEDKKEETGEDNIGESNTTEERQNVEERQNGKDNIEESNTTEERQNREDSEKGDEKKTEKKKLTKSQKRELRSQERLQGKKEYRLKQKENRKKKRRAKIEEILAQGGNPSHFFASKKRKISDLPSSTHTVVVDLGFDSSMTNNEILSLSQQLVLAYGYNNRRNGPLKLCWTNFEGKLREQIEKHNGWMNWKITISGNSYLDLFPKEKLIYLTADSDNILDVVDTEHIYIIGGIVDHNRLRKITLDKANQQEIAHARLPIEEYLNMASRKVITVNQVIELMIEYITSNCWDTALKTVLPKRKNALSKDIQQNTQTSNNENNTTSSN